MNPWMVLGATMCFVSSTGILALVVVGILGTEFSGSLNREPQPEAFTPPSEPPRNKLRLRRSRRLVRRIYSVTALFLILCALLYSLFIIGQPA